MSVIRKTHQIPKRRSTVFLRNLDRDMKDTFKAWCAERGITMVDGFTCLVEYALSHPKVDKHVAEYVARNRSAG